MHMHVDPRIINGVLTIDIHISPPAARPLTFVAGTRITLDEETASHVAPDQPVDINVYLSLKSI